jgi:hypothetical protein
MISLHRKPNQIKLSPTKRFHTKNPPLVTTAYQQVEEFGNNACRDLLSLRDEAHEIRVLLKPIQNFWKGAKEERRQPQAKI